MIRIDPYLNFDGNCREAMNFYKDCLGGQLELTTVKESSIADKMPAAIQEQIMHSSLTNGSVMILASDMHRNKLVNGNSVSQCIYCTSAEELRSIFSRLSAGGTVTDPPAVQFWGDTFCAFIDKYGKQWSLVYHPANA